MPFLPHAPAFQFGNSAASNCALCNRTILLPQISPTSSSMASAIMATHALSVAGLSSSLLPARNAIKGLPQGPVSVSRGSRVGFVPIRAAKLPRGVEAPRDEPKLPVPFWGFTENAEVWNSRASLIGIFGIIIVEAIIHKGLLQTIGIDVGKGLDLPL